MTKIPHLCFADAVFQCKISKKICQHGNCQECTVAAYFMSFDYDKLERIVYDIEGI